MKEIILKFESEEDYDVFLNTVIIPGIEKGDTTYDKESNVATIRKDENSCHIRFL